MRTFGEFLNWTFPVGRRTWMLGTAIGTIVVAFGISAKQARAVESNGSVKPAQVEMQGGQSFGVEAGVGLARVEQAAQQQSGAGEDNDAEGDLGGSESAPEVPAAKLRGIVFEGILQVELGGLERRHQAEDDGGDEA